MTAPPLREQLKRATQWRVCRSGVNNLNVRTLTQIAMISPCARVLVPCEIAPPPTRTGRGGKGTRRHGTEDHGEKGF